MLDQMDGTIRHRLLMNYRADPAVVEPLLPAGFRPQLVDGQAVVGVCVLRLADLRPHGVPGSCGLTSDNAAHRVAVEWDGPTGTEVGVYVLRRDAAQRLPVLLGGRVFPGVHGRAAFTVAERPDGIDVALRTADGIDVRASTTVSPRWTSELFATASEALTFFDRGRCGWSAGRRDRIDALEMQGCCALAVPVDVDGGSSYWEDTDRFPAGAVVRDASLLMRDLPVSWTRMAA
jgi:hypothetical protein